MNDDLNEIRRLLTQLESYAANQAVILRDVQAWLDANGRDERDGPQG